MYGPRVFVSMIAVLTVFGVALYWMSGSVLSAFLQTLLCAFILQAGYFVAILYLVRREKVALHREAHPVVQAAPLREGAAYEDMGHEPARLSMHDR